MLPTNLTLSSDQGRGTLASGLHVAEDNKKMKRPRSIGQENCEIVLPMPMLNRDWIAKRFRAFAKPSFASKFFFSAMSWAYHWFKAEKRKITFTYDNCPFECRNDEKQWDEFRREYCEDCPHRRADERLLSNATAIFKERFGQELAPEQFKKMLNGAYGRGSRNGGKLA